MKNDAFIKKAIDAIQTSDFLNGGRLNPEQQAEFLVLVRQFSKMIPLIRNEQLDQPRMDVDKLHVGEPITESAAEDTVANPTGKPKFNKVEINAKKVRSVWHITTDSLEENIAMEDLENQVEQAMMSQIGTDLENLAINGDSSLTGTDPLSTLLKHDDGFDKLSDDAHIVDVEGGFLSKRIFSAMLRQMPKQFRGDPNLRWFVSRGANVDWMDINSDRQTASGDASLSGNAPAPFGIPVVEVPLIPDDKLVGVKTATNAVHIGKRFGPFTITSTNKTVILNVDGAGAVTVTLTEGTFEAFEIAGQINAADPSLAGVAGDDGEGRLILRSRTSGTSSSIVVGAGTSNATLGLTAGTYVGVNSGTSSSVPEGTFIWLSNPRNFIWAIVKATRVHSFFRQENDRIETVVYNKVDTQIENKNALVKAINIRVRSI